MKLLVYHSEIITKGLTTYQDIKESEVKYRRFQKRLNKSQNIKSKLCYNNNKSFFNPKGIYISTYGNNHLQSTQGNVNQVNYENIVQNENNQCIINNELKINEIGLESFKDKIISNNRTINSHKYLNKLNIKPGEILYSEDEEKEIRDDYNNKLNINEIIKEENSQKNNSLDRKIFSIINSSGTLEDNNNGKNIILSRYSSYKLHN